LDHSEEILGTLLERERGEKGELREGNVSVERNIFFFFTWPVWNTIQKEERRRGGKGEYSLEQRSCVPIHRFFVAFDAVDFDAPVE
jgi:hypothetical protein